MQRRTAICTFTRRSPREKKINHIGLLSERSHVKPCPTMRVRVFKRRTSVKKSLRNGKASWAAQVAITVIALEHLTKHILICGRCFRPGSGRDQSMHNGGRSCVREYGGAIPIESIQVRACVEQQMNALRRTR